MAVLTSSAGRACLDHPSRREFCLCRVSEDVGFLPARHGLCCITISRNITIVWAKNCNKNDPYSLGQSCNCVSFFPGGGGKGRGSLSVPLGRWPESSSHEHHTICMWLGGIAE